MKILKNIYPKVHHLPKNTSPKKPLPNFLPSLMKFGSNASALCLYLRKVSFTLSGSSSKQTKRKE